MSPRPPYVDNPYRTGCEQSPPLQPLQPSTCTKHRYERLAEALQLYSPLQPSTALHPLQYTSLYSTPQICRRVRERRRDGDACEHAAAVHSYVLRTVVACVVFSRILEL